MTLAERPAEAEVKLHALMTGSAAVEVDVGVGAGAYRTKFTQANAAQLAAYMEQLKAEIAGAPQRGAVGFWF
jgi:hypothetical protein